MIIDMHTHIFPEKIAARTIEILKKGIEEQQGEAFPAYTDATISGLRQQMRREEVAVSVVLPIATKITQTPTINAYAKSIRSADVISFASLHPMQEDWEEVLEGIREDGFVGIKLHPEFQRVRVDARETIRIVKKAEELGLYVVFHAGSDVGIAPPVHSTPLHFKHLLEECSGRNVIAAHMGGFQMWDEAERLLVGTPIYMDLAVVPRFMDAKQCRCMIRAHGADKILFGSDSPWERPAQVLRYLEGMNLTAEEMDQITHKNAMGILGL